MNRQSIHQQIESLLKIIQEEHNHIRQHKDSIPQTELDFMIQNLRQLYEAVLLLNHSNTLSYLDEVKSAMAQKILAEKRALDLKKNEIKSELPKMEPSEVAETPQVIEKSENIQVEKPIDISANDVAFKPIEESKSREKNGKLRKSDLNSTLYEDKPTLGDKFGNGESLHKKIASQTTNKTLADKHHHKPIKDLKAAIGINEKFLFINQLFEGNLQSYSEAIEKVNSFSDMQSAKQFVTVELATRLNWNNDNEHVRSFMELVARRFT